MIGVDEYIRLLPVTCFTCNRRTATVVYSIKDKVTTEEATIYHEEDTGCPSCSNPKPAKRIKETYNKANQSLHHYMSTPITGSGG